jgi:aryl-alcohol dehydrogenase-like predicted oxidoreductase
VAGGVKRRGECDPGAASGFPCGYNESRDSTLRGRARAAPSPALQPPDMTAMKYRRLGDSGLKVSELSFGSWVTYGNQMDTGAARDCMAAAWDAGVNFFDNAEVYANGKSEEIMGAALKELAWPRVKYVVSTKFFWGITEGSNSKNTLNRKYLMDAIDHSLKRLQLDYVDLVYCHRADPDTPIEETVWAMHDMIERGKALYWGTSEWDAASLHTR